MKCSVTILPLSSYTQIRGDNSRQEICALLQIHKTCTTAYHPHCNGLVEKFNCTLLDMLSTVVKDHPSDRVGPVNTESVFSVKFMFSCIHPFYLMYGCQVKLPVDLMYVPHMKFITLWVIMHTSCVMNSKRHVCWPDKMVSMRTRGKRHYMM